MKPWMLASIFVVMGGVGYSGEEAVEPAPVVVAEETRRMVGVTLKVDTRGLGGDVTVNILPWLNARVGLQKGDVDIDVDLDEALVDGTLALETIPLLLDIHPGSGEFRISLGVVINNNEVRLSADPTEPLELEGTDYSITSLDGSISFDETSYYVGIGVGDACGENGRVHFAFDLGVMYHGSPDVEASATATLPAAALAQLDSDLQAEVTQLEDDISSFQWYPVIAFGVSVSF